jgi:hypothetical protein
MYNECCKILGVKPGSDLSTIKSAYRKAAKELHPDLNHFENAGKYFIILQNAYHFLLDHPFSAKEIELVRRSEEIKQKIKLRRDFYINLNSRTSPLVERTLQEVLDSSFTARFIYFFLHFLFLLLGIYMVCTSVYDAFYCTVDPVVSAGSAYITIVFAFIFGIILTVIILFTGINSIRRR